ncbi:MAG: antitoxin [Beutenbergiaceae bacterium]
MRTTVTLDSDVEQLIRARMQQGVSFKQALNDAIRDGASARGPLPEPFQTPTFDMGSASIDLVHGLRVAADLEDAAVAGRMAADG